MIEAQSAIKALNFRPARGLKCFIGLAPGLDKGHITTVNTCGPRGSMPSKPQKRMFHHIFGFTSKFTENKIVGNTKKLHQYEYKIGDNVRGRITRNAQWFT